MKRICLAIFIITAFGSCAQQRKIIQEEHAYFMVRMPGAVKGDSNGQQEENSFDTVTVVYVEIRKDSSLVWERAWKGNKSYSISAVEVKQLPVTVGTARSSKEKIVLNPGRGNVLYLLELKPVSNTLPPVTVKPNELLLTGRVRDQPLNYVVKNFTELTVPFYQ